MNNFRYTNEKCPVCGQSFAEDSEIVVCPLCGTPHHRDCYNKNGECGNSEKHNEGFVWKPEAEPEISEQPVEQNPQLNNNPYTNSNPYSNGNAGTPPYGAPFQPQIAYQMPNFLNAYPPEIEDGVSTEDAAGFIKKNTHTYLRKFFAIKSGKRTFNLAAFFFGGYWFIYRKMYKLGAIFIALTFALSAIPLFVPQYVQLQKELDNISYEYESAVENSGGSIDELNSAMNKMYSSIFAAVKKHPAGVAVSAVTLIGDLALSVYLGIIADRKYKEHVEKSVKAINVSDESVKNEDFRKLRILSEGGTTFGYAILALLAVSGINYALSAVLNMLNM